MFLVYTFSGRYHLVDPCGVEKENAQDRSTHPSNATIKFLYNLSPKTVPGIGSG